MKGDPILRAFGRRAVLGLMLASLTVSSLVGPVAALDDGASAGRQDGWHRAELQGRDQPYFDTVVSWTGGLAALGHHDSGRLDTSMWLSRGGSRWRQATDWRQAPTAKGRATTLVAFEDGLLAFGTAGRRLLAWRSEDGDTWERLADRRAFRAPRGTPPEHFLELLGVAATRARVVVSGAYSLMGAESYPWTWSSSTGRSWRRSKPGLPHANTIHQPRAAKGRFHGVSFTHEGADGCRDGESYLPIVSDTGRQWDVVDGAEPVCGLGPIAMDERSGDYFATEWEVDRGDARVIRSPALVEWSLAYELPEELDGAPIHVSADDIHAAHGTVAVVGSIGRKNEIGDTENYPFAVISTDGSGWHFVAPWTDHEVEYAASALSGDRLVVAAEREIWYADIEDLVP